MSPLEDNCDRGYICSMNYQVIRSGTFLRWLENLRDERAQARIATRIERAEEGNFGDHQSVGQGVSEMRVHGRSRGTASTTQFETIRR